MLEAIVDFLVDFLKEFVTITFLGTIAGTILWVLFFRKKSSLANYLLESDPYGSITVVALPIVTVVLLIEYHQSLFASLQGVLN